MSLGSLYRPRVVDEVSQSPIGCKLSRGIIADARYSLTHLLTYSLPLIRFTHSNLPT